MELIDVTNYNNYYHNDTDRNWVTPVIMASCYIMGASSCAEPKASSVLFLSWPKEEEREGFHEANRA
jgi:hypothetical protein